MRPTLQNPSVVDEDLIEAMNMAMSAETERLNKFSATGRVKQAHISSLEMAQANTKEKKDEGRVLAALKAVQSDMATMQSEIKTLRETVSKVREPTNGNEGGNQTTRDRTRRGCQKCQGEGMSNTCNHCFICGGSNHIARYCRLKYRNQGNQRGLPPRDRE